MKIIKRIKERWNEIKALVLCDEYFLGISNRDSNFEPWRKFVSYKYFNNTNRDVFYTFIHDYIENNLRSITGKFICIREYKDEYVNINCGQYVEFERGFITKILDNIDGESIHMYEHKIPIEEIFSHFKIIK